MPDFMNREFVFKSEDCGIWPIFLKQTRYVYIYSVNVKW